MLSKRRVASQLPMKTAHNVLLWEVLLFGFNISGCRCTWTCGDVLSRFLKRLCIDWAEFEEVPNTFIMEIIDLVGWSAFLRALRCPLSLGNHQLLPG